MPVIALRTSVPANGRSGNVLAGSPYEFLSADSIVQFAMTQPAGTPANVVADLQIGGESMASAANLDTTNAYPNFHDNLFCRCGGRAGERLFLDFVNSTAGVLNVDTLIEISPL